MLFFLVYGERRDTKECHILTIDKILEHGKRLHSTDPAKTKTLPCMNMFNIFDELSYFSKKGLFLFLPDLGTKPGELLDHLFIPSLKMLDP